MGSMAHYQMTSILCGPDSLDESSKLVGVNDWLGTLPYFRPPRLPLKNGSDYYCSAVTNRTQPRNIWNHIPNGDPSQRAYNGLVDLLYHELDPRITGERGIQFESWWKEKATRPTLELLWTHVGKIQEYIGQLAGEVLSGDSPFLDALSLGEKNNITENIVEQFQFYFQIVFDPIYKQGADHFVEESLPRSLSLDSPPYQVQGLDQHLDHQYKNQMERRLEFKNTYWEDLKVEIIDGFRRIPRELKFSEESAMKAIQALGRSLIKFEYLFQIYDNIFYEDRVKKYKEKQGHYEHPILSLSPQVFGKSLGYTQTHYPKSMEQEPTPTYRFVAKRTYGAMTQALYDYYIIFSLRGFTPEARLWKKPSGERPGLENKTSPQGKSSPQTMKNE